MIEDDDIPLSLMPDFDDTMRRLSDLLMMHKICRRRTCQRNEGCQGGFGPPCFLERRHLFVDAIAAEMDEYREYWCRLRKRAKLRCS